MPDAADRVRMALAEAGYDLEVVEQDGLIHVRQPGTWSFGAHEDGAHETVAKACDVAEVDELRRCCVCGVSDG